MTPDLKQIAIKAIQDFHIGELTSGDQLFQVTFTEGYLAQKFCEWAQNHSDWPDPTR